MIERIKPSEALIAAREFLKNIESQFKKIDKKEVNTVNISKIPEVKPKITRIYTIKDVVEKAIQEDPIANKLPTEVKEKLAKIISEDPDIVNKT